MKSLASRFWSHRLLALALFGAVGCAHALSSSNPPIRMAAQGVEYMCGGTGKAEEAFMEMVAPRWAAGFQFAINQQSQGRTAVVGVKLKVRDAYNGYLVMDVTADAPRLLARLTPGVYTVEATLDGLTLIQSLNVVHGASSNALFVWPSNLSAPVQAQAALGK